MCSLVKWSVRLNDPSDFGVPDELDLEAGAVGPSIRLMMARLQKISFGQEAD